MGGCNVAAQRLMDVTERSLLRGIAQAVAGNRVVDISRAIQFTWRAMDSNVVRDSRWGIAWALGPEPADTEFCRWRVAHQT